VDVKVEDCCSPIKNKEMKGGNKTMDTKTIVLWIVIAVLAIATIYVMFFQGGTSGNAVSAGQSAGQVASSGMVGGC
jgi:hypothetical protein